MKEFEEILKKFGCINSNDDIDRKDALEALKEAYTLGRNKTADWIAEHGKAVEWSKDGSYGVAIDADSILSAKTCKELDL